MTSVTLEQVEEQLRHLAPEQLAKVAQFINALASSEHMADEEYRDLLLAAETSLCKDWDTPEEDAAWSHL